MLALAMRQAFLRLACALAIAIGLTGPAASLSADEAARVSALLVELSSELGRFAYDDEEADRIFEEDAAWNGRITAAGFSREEWKRAVDAGFRGYLATIPTNVFSETLTKALRAAETMPNLSDEQRAEILPFIEEKIAEIQLLRAEGAAYADAVRPYASQIETAFDTGLDTGD